MNAIATAIPFPGPGRDAEEPQCGRSVDYRARGQQHLEGTLRATDIRSKLDYLIVEQQERIKRRQRDAERQAEKRGYRMRKADWRYRMAEARLEDLQDIRDFLQHEHGV